MRTRMMIISLVALLLMAALPGVALAAKAFSAEGVIVREEAGSAVLDLTTGLLVTTGQVFEGELSESSWRKLRGADITVHQNSAIGANPFELFLAGSTLLAGQAYGEFEIENGRNDAIQGTYGADIFGALVVDQTCPATSVFAGLATPLPDGSILVLPDMQVRANVFDSGDWSVIQGSASGAYRAINQMGGSLEALASGCIGGAETASLKITGLLGQGDDDDRDRGSGDDRGPGDDDDQDRGNDNDRGRGDDDDRDRGSDDDRRRGDDDDRDRSSDNHRGRGDDDDRDRGSGDDRRRGDGDGRDPGNRS